ncbi:hypothetical protein GCM10011608_06270 [Micromonospora sonchi]|uniref:Uncharacterized protein n=1 Tax=Micromonospora sonchi TaxID=1763543 RepID=A0A917THZ1_9ACTN|nr:hypothetical protein [Micromonospora sonchi]GGM24155.1 hypothetical protein GCM10011608_06270 [Micromonospora sonchi]
MTRAEPGSCTGKPSGPAGRPGREVKMRALLWTVGVIAAILVLLGLLLEAVRWLVIIGIIALAAVIVLASFRGRRSAQNYPSRR